MTSPSRRSGTADPDTIARVQGRVLKDDGERAILVGGPLDGREHQVDPDTGELVVVMDDGARHQYVFEQAGGAKAGRPSATGLRVSRSGISAPLPPELRAPHGAFWGTPAPREWTYTPGMTDIERNYRVASDGFDAAVKKVGSDEWERQSPCEEWLARDVVAHIVQGHRGVIANVRGGDSKPLGDDEDPAQAWNLATVKMSEITHDAEALALEVDGPTGTVPAGEIIGSFVTMDLLVHTWDGPNDWRRRTAR